MHQSIDQTDLLTGLPNITYFRSLSQKVLDDPSERIKGLVFIYFDVKNFRAYNYRHGFDAGDRYLVKLGNTIRSTFPELYVSRFADDHFLAVAYARDLDARLEQVRAKTVTDRMSRNMTIKAGVYSVPNEPNLNSVRAYDNAKLACESIKQKSDVLTCYYSAELGYREKLREHIIETVDLAIEKEYIRVYYQPIVHVMSGRLCGYEGLARWVDPEFGFLSPVDFISTLEDARLIHRLDTFMIHRMCRDMHEGLARGWTIVPVSVNLSAIDFEMAEMPVIAAQAIRENHLPKDFLNIEITESAFSTGGREIHDVLDQFRAHGFEIWMDNFGSKHSSLNLLQDVDIDLIKLDMKILRDFHTNPRTRTILKNMMNMAKELGIRTLMEGVEDTQVLEFLRQTGCEQAQGYLFGRPTKIEDLRHVDMEPESSFTRSYYNTIGSVNLLSPTPLKTGWFSPSDQSVDELNGIPIGLAEYDGDRFKFLMTNSSFRSIFRDLGVDGRDTPDDVFNNQQLQFSINFRDATRQCIESGRELTQDFVTSQGFNNIRLRCVAFNPETNVGAILAVVEQIGADAALQRERKKSYALKFLYSLYTRVDLIRQDGAAVENIYLNSSRYRGRIVGGDFLQTITIFAEENIYSEDRQKFLEFYDMSTIDQRLWEVGGNQITDYFRTRDDQHNYSWQMYMLVPTIMSGQKYLLSCVRGIDTERMRRLPEIDRMGTEYYDMPGNPIFLLLASRAFTTTLGYGSFEQFLQNSFYVEANLTTNKVLSMHLDKLGIVSRTGYEAMNYDETARDMTLRIVIDEQQAEINWFFDRKRLLEEYANGRFCAEREFFRRPEPNSRPRYMHTSYQLRESNETGDIHMFFLSFDIDSYRRTREHITMLLERDTLTGLYNRRMAVEFTSEWLARAAGRRSALVILDLDNFKQINDRFGHECGDQVLKDAAARMKAAFSAHGLVARIGGDEFLALIKDQTVVEVDWLICEFSDSIKELNYHGHSIRYTMSIGYAMYPEFGVEYNALYQNADAALYMVKMSGRANYRGYVASMSGVNRDQMGFSIAQVAEGIPGGFLVYRDNEAQEILYANRRTWEIYECESFDAFRRLTGNSFKGCVCDKDWDLVRRTISAQLEISDGYDYVQYRARTAKGNIRLIEDFGRRLHSPDEGDIFYVFLIDLEQKERIYHTITLARQLTEEE